MRLSRFSSWIPAFVVILVLVFSATPAQPLSGSALVAGPPPAPDQRLALPHLPAAATAGSFASQTLADTDFKAWSAGVYQFVADNNWEIGLVNGGQETRLTTHGAMDIHPRVNRGGTKIAFASNRTGVYQIYTMNLDGSGLKQLTFTNADNGNPAWSQDSRRIAFESYRDGQAEIYVMDADGANQTRLTAADGPDTHPTWSPDGAQIAFSSVRTGGYRIWIMQADGSGARQVTTQAYSLYPAWSPDGLELAYSCDNDGDGWLEAWRIRTDGTAAEQFYRGLHTPPYYNDVWVRGWAPDGQGVALTLVEMVYYAGKWYWTTGRLYVANNYQVTVILSGTDAGWNPDFQTKDLQPPTATLQPVPELQPAGPLRVRSDILQDNGTAGAVSDGAYLEFQYRTGDAPWQTETWHWSMISYSGYYYHDFFGVAGSTIAFRFRARDNAYNQSAWYPSDAGASVMLYSRKLEGQVREARGTPSPGAALTSDLPMLGATQTDSGGRYTRYSLVDATHILTITQTGYGALPATQAWLLEDMDAVHILPPRQDLIVNGHFESALGPAWQTGGVVGVGNFAAHSGFGGAHLGSTDWGYSDPGSGVLTQTLTLPEDVHAPTLSVLFRREWGLMEDIFRIAVQDAAATTTLLEVNSSTGVTETMSGDWMHAWFDMDAWRGQTITVTLSLLEVDDGVSSEVHVDEVTLGAWESPQVSAVTPGSIEVGTTGPITVTGGNYMPAAEVRFGSTPASAVAWVDAWTLRVTPPATLAHGVYDVVVSNPGGAFGVLFGGLRVGFQTYLPVALRSHRSW